MKRNRVDCWDLLCGILIVLVVIGHSAEKGHLLHDIIFLFHMPLFFMLSGVLLKREKLIDLRYVEKRVFDLMIPYICYLLIDWLLVRKEYSPLMLIRLIWGGRALSGTYWYITCFITALFLFGFMLKHFDDKMSKLLIFSGGGMAILESHISEQIDVIASPGIPWNMDVALLALVYLSVGFYHKGVIWRWSTISSKKYDAIAGLLTILLTAFCVINYWNGRRLYYFDMKTVYYRDLFLAIIIPCTFGLVLCRGVYWISQFDVMIMKRILCFLGRTTIPIMFLHIPLNTWRDNIGYGRIVYLLIGVCVPIIITFVFSRFKIMRKIFGLPDLSK